MAASSNAAVAEGRAGPRKREVVSQLTDMLSRATSAVVTDYRGLTNKQLEELRATLRANGVEYVVVKNTLARRAAEAAGVGDFSAVLNGPVGLAIGYDDVSRPAKLLSDYFKANKRLPMLAGLVEKQILDSKGVAAIADLPSRDVLLGQLAGTLLAPLSQLAAALNSPLSELAATLDAYRDKLEKAA